MSDREPTSHLTDPELAALLDPGIDAGERVAIERSAGAAAHAAACAKCDAAIRAAREDEMMVGDALRALDHAIPLKVTPQMVVTARPAARGRPAGVGARRVTGRASMSQRAALLARTGALITLAAAAAAAAVAPHSPIRRVVARWFSEPVAVPPTSVNRDAPAPVGEAHPSMTASRGVAVVPGTRVDVVFRGGGPGSFVRIVRSDSATLAVRSDVAGPAFVVARDSVLVDAGAAGGASYEVRVPRGAPLVRVRIGTRVIFGQEDSRVSASVAPDASGVYAIPLAPSEVRP